MSEREEDCIKTNDGECFVIFLVNTREKGFQNLLGLVKQQVKATDKMMIYPDWKLKVDEVKTSQEYLQREQEINELRSSEDNIQKRIDDMACINCPHTSQAILKRFNNLNKLWSK